MSVSGTRQFTLLILEQPAKLHRFRYLKEIKDGRMGSILHSRSSTKTPVKVRVTRNHHDVSTECCVKLICCTVFDDLMPHPFYLFGDNCNGGIFEKEVTFPAGKYDCDICLDRIGIVCTPKKQKATGKTKTEAAIEETVDGGSYERRCSAFNFFRKATRTNPFQGKDINKLKLAFQVFVESPVAADCDPVASEPIQDAKIYSELTVDYVIPKTVTRWAQDVWLYMKDPLPAESATRFEVSVEIPTFDLIKLPSNQVKKHLVVFNFNKLKESNLPKTASLLVRVVDKETGDSSGPVELQLKLPPLESEEPASKKQRQADKSIDPNSGDLLCFFVPDYISGTQDVKMQGIHGVETLPDVQDSQDDSSSDILSEITSVIGMEQMDNTRRPEDAPKVVLMVG